MLHKRSATRSRLLHVLGLLAFGGMALIVYQLQLQHTNAYMGFMSIDFGVAYIFPALFFSALLVVLGVVINRINVFLVAYHPPYADYSYFPSTMEILFTVGMAATLMLVYRIAVTIFPILPREEESH